TSRTVGALASSTPLTGSFGTCSWSRRVRSTSRMALAGTTPVLDQARPPSPSAMTTIKTTRPPMKAKIPTRIRHIRVSLSRPDAEFLIGQHHAMEPTDESGRPKIGRLIVVHDLHNLLKTFDHGLLEARVHQFEFINAVQHLLAYRGRKGALSHGFDAGNHLAPVTNPDAFFHQPKTHVVQIFDPFEIAHRDTTGISVDVGDNHRATLAQDRVCF